VIDPFLPAEHPDGRERVLGEEAVVPLCSGVALAALVVDQGHDAGACVAFGVRSQP
jgi:hypothetical protein